MANFKTKFVLFRLLGLSLFLMVLFFFYLLFNSSYSENKNDSVSAKKPFEDVPISVELNEPTASEIVVQTKSNPYKLVEVTDERLLKICKYAIEDSFEDTMEGGWFNRFDEQSLIDALSVLPQFNSREGVCAPDLLNVIGAHYNDGTVNDGRINDTLLVLLEGGDKELNSLLMDKLRGFMSKDKRFLDYVLNEIIESGTSAERARYIIMRLAHNNKKGKVVLDSNDIDKILAVTLNSIKKMPFDETKERYIIANELNTLGGLADKRGTGTVLYVLGKFTDKFDRSLAVRVLGEIGDEKALDTLHTVMLDLETHEYVRNAAIEAIGKIKSSKSVVKILEDIKTRGANTYHGRIVTNFIDKETQDKLIDSFSGDKPYKREPRYFNYNLRAYMLSHFLFVHLAEESKDVLLKFYKSDRPYSVRQAIAEAVSENNVFDKKDFFLKVLENEKDGPPMINIVEFLAENPDSDEVVEGVILKLLSSKRHIDVRKAAIKAIAKFKTKKSLDASLSIFVHDDDSEMRSLSFDTINLLGGKDIIPILIKFINREYSYTKDLYETVFTKVCDLVHKYDGSMHYTKVSCTREILNVWFDKNKSLFKTKNIPTIDEYLNLDYKSNAERTKELPLERRYLAAKVDYGWEDEKIEKTLKAALPLKDGWRIESAIDLENKVRDIYALSPGQEITLVSPFGTSVATVDKVTSTSWGACDGTITIYLENTLDGGCDFCIIDIANKPEDLISDGVLPNHVATVEEDVKKAISDWAKAASAGRVDLSKLVVSKVPSLKDDDIYIVTETPKHEDMYFQHRDGRDWKSYVFVVRYNEGKVIKVAKTKAFLNRSIGTDKPNWYDLDKDGNFETLISDEPRSGWGALFEVSENGFNEKRIMWEYDAPCD